MNRQIQTDRCRDIFTFLLPSSHTLDIYFPDFSLLIYLEDSCTSIALQRSYFWVTFIFLFWGGRVGAEQITFISYPLGLVRTQVQLCIKLIIMDSISFEIVAQLYFRSSFYHFVLRTSLGYKSNNLFIYLIPLNWFCLCD